VTLGLCSFDLNLLKAEHPRFFCPPQHRRLHPSPCLSSSWAFSPVCLGQFSSISLGCNGLGLWLGRTGQVMGRFYCRDESVSRSHPGFLTLSSKGL
jgi:hypothetical protein